MRTLKVAFGLGLALALCPMAGRAGTVILPPFCGTVVCWASTTTNGEQALPDNGLAQDTTVPSGFGLNYIAGFLAAPTDFFDVSTSADLYKIRVSNPLAFSATVFSDTVSDSSFAPQLFLFDSQGFAVAGAPSLIGTADVLQPLTAGIYYLGVSAQFLDPASQGGDLLFCTFDVVLLPPGCTVGGAFLSDPQPPLGSWIGTHDIIPGGAVVGLSIDPGGDPYHIELQGVNTPEPISVLLAAGGLALVAGLMRRRKARELPPAA